MPEEEFEYLDDVDNEDSSGNSNISSSKSSLIDTASNIIDSSNYKKSGKDTSNVESNDNNSNNIIDFDSYKNKGKNATDSVKNNIIDFDKYKSRKNNSFDNVSNNASNNNQSLIRNGLKNNAANTVINKVSNLHPALKALNTINNVRNVVARKNNNPTADSVVNDKNNNTFLDKEESLLDSDGTDTGSEESGEVKSLNPLQSLFGGTTSLLGQFSFFGKIPKPLKFAIIFGGPLIAGLFFIMIVSTVVGYFSGFWGLDTVEASNGSAGNIDYGDYSLSSDGHEILHQSLDSFLESKESSLTEFNNLIASNVQDAGYGTRAGVVASAVTLIAELGNNYNVKVPYYWGGGHGQMIVGADGSWGSNQCSATANGRIYDYCGLDCSGFVSWAIYNGGFNIAARTTGYFQSLPGAERVTLSNSAVLQPGDLLESGGHVILVVDVDEENGTYICAEASGYESGVLFSTHPFNSSGYWGVNMEGFYNRDGQVR